MQDLAFSYGPQILRKDGRLNLTDSASAGLLLKSVFTSYVKVPDRYDASGKVLTYRINVSGRVRFLDKKSGEDFVKPANITGTTIWNPDLEPEEEAVKRALEDFYSQAVRHLFSSVEW